MLCELMVNHPDFRRLDDVEGVCIDLRYVGANNFVGRDLYGALDCRWLHAEAATALRESVAILRANHPSYKLLVLDALRPHRIQEMLWTHLEGTSLRAYIADPARGSIHSFGMFDISHRYSYNISWHNQKRFPVLLRLILILSTESRLGKIPFWDNSLIK